MKAVLILITLSKKTNKQIPLNVELLALRQNTFVQHGVTCWNSLQREMSCSDAASCFFLWIDGSVNQVRLVSSLLVRVNDCKVPRRTASHIMFTVVDVHLVCPTLMTNPLQAGHLLGAAWSPRWSWPCCRWALPLSQLVPAFSSAGLRVENNQRQKTSFTSS